MAGTNIHPPNGFRDLYLDLFELSQNTDELLESRLYLVERLRVQLEARLVELKDLLDKPPKNDKSRRCISAGKVWVDDVEWSLNEDFKQDAIQLADALNLDELEAARMLVRAQSDADSLGRSLLETCIIRFHSERKNLLSCIMLLLKMTVETEGDEATREYLTDYVGRLVSGSDGHVVIRNSFALKCLTAMTDIMAWIQDLVDRIQGANILGAQQPAWYAEILDFQQTSLTLQHEDLGVIICYLVKGRHTRIRHFAHKLLRALRYIERYDQLSVHLLPAWMASLSKVGSPESDVPFDEAKSFHDIITSTADADSWSLRYLHAASITWWLSEYGGRFPEHQEQTATPGVNVETESAAQSKLFYDALKDGAFDFILSLSVDVKPAEWHDSVKYSLRQWLQKKAPSLMPDPTPFTADFQTLLMEHLENFIDAIITHMPTNLRHLRSNEDQQRLRLLDVDPLQQELDLEKFILIISCTFEGRPDAAKGFWSDPDSNLFGFLQWSTKRLTTPRACAATEMVLSLSQGEENATSAHHFLLNESTTSVGKIRKSNSLNWFQILQDLRHFAEVREPSAAPPRLISRTGKSRTEQSSGEPETYSMLESYLRLTAQLAGNSPVARSWLLTQTTYPVLELLFLWCNNSIPSRLRACAFDTMRALLIGKTLELSGNLWQLLDLWIFGGAQPPSSFPKTTPSTPAPLPTPGAVFEMICEGFEEANAFVALLDLLMSPYPDNEGISDALPFPEHLGSAYRMPGVEPYIDFVLGKVFSSKLPQIQDVFQQRLLRQTCLGFVVTCLSTFNVNLLDFANASSIAIDVAITASSLSAYVRLHPFSRVMEWFFNDKVLQELFATARQEVEEVAKVSSNSSLVVGVNRSINVMYSVLEMQYTYLDITRPLIQKMDANNRGTAVANAALASFEDAVLDNFDLTVYLGLYSTTEHINLIIPSLALLEKITTSPKLRNAQRKILSVYDLKGDTKRVTKSMTIQMSFEDRELAIGPASPEYLTKERILSFLKGCLERFADRPNIAHLLLGFSCSRDTIEVSPESDFANNKALFHSILNIICQFPDAKEGILQNWLLNIKRMGLEVLQSLWESPLSTVYTMTELRACDFLFHQLAGLSTIDSKTLFDGRSVEDPLFLSTDSASCYENFLHRRCILLEYLSMEIRVVAANRAPTLKGRIVTALLGTTITLNGDQISNPTVLDLFDFANLELDEQPTQSVLHYCPGPEFNVCMKSGPGLLSLYDEGRLEQLLFLRQRELEKSGKISADQEESLHLEFMHIIAGARAHNNRVSLLQRRLLTLTAWARLVILMIEIGDIRPELKAEFILTALQKILPKLEWYINEDSKEALELAKLSKVLLFNMDPISGPRGKFGQADDPVSGRLFRISLRGICCPTAKSELREILYNICHRYIIGFWETSSNAMEVKRNGVKVIKESGETLMDAVCDDAYSGNGGCRISALLFLDALISFTQEERFSYVMDSLVRLNFLGLLVDSLKDMTGELTNTPGPDIPLLLSYYNAKLSLLLRISQTKQGAAHIFNAGLFQSIRESTLFSIDPDLGLDIDNPEALKKYYHLLLSILRIITSVVMSRGPQNQQTLFETRRFLSDNRQTVVTIFKRYAKIGSGGGGGGGDGGVGATVTRVEKGSKPEIDLGGLVRNLVLLISATDFLDFEERTSLGDPSFSSSTSTSTSAYKPNMVFS
ncbi:MAG: hypothetical protein M1816_004757 [Peltula sp. TS41687]|nr:MAG: hypothetical protein M1816_004757 [Peltula sp. TS41687]